MESSPFKWLKSTVFPSRVRCEGLLEEDMDNPQYSKMNPMQSFDEIEQEDVMRTRVSPLKPPSFDSFMNGVKSITKKFDHIKGFKFELGVPISHVFHTLHVWNILPPSKSNLGPAGATLGQGSQGQYTFMCNYAGGISNPTPMSAPSFILTGRTDNQGKLEASIIKPFNDRTSLRVNFGFLNEDTSAAQVHADLDYAGDDYAATVKFGTQVLSFSLMQSIGRRLILGFETACIQKKIFAMGYAGIYRHNRKHSFYAHWNAMQQQMTLAYLQKVNPSAQLVSEFNYTPAEKESTNFVLGFRQRFENTEVLSTISSKGKLSSLIHIVGGFYHLKLCANANYKKDSYKFGYGISLGQVN
eukprot:CAMPEP_0176464400 /NCGR_PEP_ID=MMETSP0127-20121128/36499_1 /TAXON_ID=938130 /ORGANISM="Platyophrya macrostoma, Strain WH" /LENGTH=355 /DNA_ID=CAMNT_0017856819 /DNA_START=51 /DNA_END=1118 /DNA_ORIENTATION=+